MTPHVRSKRSAWLSVALAVLAMGFALEVHPLSWRLVLLFIPLACLASAAPTLLSIDESRPRRTRAFTAASIGANIGFIIGLFTHRAHG